MPDEIDRLHGMAWHCVRKHKESMALFAGSTLLSSLDPAVELSSVHDERTSTPMTTSTISLGDDSGIFIANAPKAYFDFGLVCHCHLNRHENILLYCFLQIT